MKDIKDALNDIFDEIETGFLRGIGFILAILFAYFIFFIITEVNIVSFLN